MDERQDRRLDESCMIMEMADGNLDEVHGFFFSVRVASEMWFGNLNLFWLSRPLPLGASTRRFLPDGTGLVLVDSMDGREPHREWVQT